MLEPCRTHIAARRSRLPGKGGVLRRPCPGIELLKQADTEVAEMPQFADAAMASNHHLKL
jgi:hypothetical protein